TVLLYSAFFNRRKILGDRNAKKIKGNPLISSIFSLFGVCCILNLLIRLLSVRCDPLPFRSYSKIIYFFKYAPGFTVGKKVSYDSILSLSFLKIIPRLSSRQSEQPDAANSSKKSSNVRF